MCYLVTIGTRAADLLEEMVRGALFVRTSRNISLRSAFPKEDQLFDLRSGPCSCDLVTPRSEPTLEHQRERQKAHFERKRWSQAKVSRALADWEAAHARRTEERAVPRTQFHATLRALAAQPGGVRVLVHFYSGLFDDEVVKPRGRISVSAAELTREGALPEDTVVEITSRAG